MQIIVAATGAVLLWIVLWSLDFKAFDGLLVVILILLLASVNKVVLGLLPGNRPTPDQ